MALTPRPPADGVAGDGLALPVEVDVACAAGRVCGPVTVTAHFADALGEPREASATVAAGEPGEVVIPGEHVRFPEVSYWLEARVVDRPAGVAAEACDEAGAGCDTVAARSPAAGTATVAVDNVVRAAFTYPDGSPAAGVPVQLYPLRDGAVWTAVTDAAGRIAVTLPRDDPWVQQRQADGRAGNVFISAVDTQPDEPPAPGAPVPVAGHRGESAAVVNFGAPRLEAAPAPQDQIVELWPDEVTFTSATADGGCEWWEQMCKEVIERERDVPEPAAWNVGGGADVTSKFEYGHSQFTRSTFLVKTGAEADWAEADVEVGSQETEAQGAEYPSDRIGPNDNRQVTLNWNWVRIRIRTCVFVFCQMTERWVPEVWDTGANDDVIPPENHHDQASPEIEAPGSDCVVELDDTKDGTTSKVA